VLHIVLLIMITKMTFFKNILLNLLVGVFFFLRSTLMLQLLYMSYYLDSLLSSAHKYHHCKQLNLVIEMPQL